MEEIRDVTYSDLNIGDSAKISKTILEDDVLSFARLSGDYNPIHIDADFAKNTVFKDRIAHGMLSAILISTLIGTRLPGKNTIYLEQQLRFTAPVFFGDTLTACVEVIEKIESKNQVILKTEVYNQSDKIVIKGQAKVMKR